jgi:hypothetical protein
MSKLSKLIILALVFITSLGLSMRNPAVAVKINKNKVATGEVFTYEIKIEGDFTKPDLKLPEFKNFKVASQSQSKSYSFKGGETKVIINITYHLFATEPGVFVIEPVIVEDQGKKYQSKAITIKVIGKPLGEGKKINPYIEKGTKI